MLNFVHGIDGAHKSNILRHTKLMGYTTGPKVSTMEEELRVLH